MLSARLVFVALCSALTLSRISSQTVVARSASPDESRVSGGLEAGAPSRPTYSQKHLSPHRMMHFGKRPNVLMPPGVFTPRLNDLYQTQARQQRVFPYSLYFELPKDRVLEQVDDEPIKPIPRGKPLEEILPLLVEMARLGSVELKQKRQNADLSPTHRYMRLFEEPEFDVLPGKLYNIPSKQEKKAKLFLDEEATSASEDDGGQQQQPKATPDAGADKGSKQTGGEEQVASGQQSSTAQDDSNIDLETRALGPIRVGSSEDFLAARPRNHFVEWLFGPHVPTEQNIPMVSYASFMKKVDPHRSAIMHFG